MLGATLRFEQRHGEDRDPFYCSPKSRKNGYGCRQKHRIHAAGKDFPVLAAPAALIEPSSNLERFLDVTTPSVPVQYFSKTTMSWSACNVEYHPYFMFGDLWESFKESSVYGAGVPLVLDESDCVVQYYVPYLSGIQLFGEQRRSALNSRRRSDDSDVDSYRDSSSDGSSDSDGETLTKYPKELSRCHPFSTVFLRSDGLSFEKHASPLEGFSSDDSEAGNTQSHLLFQFFEQDVPCSRVPLADKILDLACQFPELKTLRSCDVLSASWMSVAWYPIYRIPTGPTLRDLDACFLTFHSLSTPLEGIDGAMGSVITFPDGLDGNPKIALPIFGLATYKFKGSIWIPNTELQQKIPNSLQQAADNWLRLLQVHHPDYQFFVSNGAVRR